MPPSKPYIAPHEIMEMLVPRILPKRRFEVEPDRQPNWVEVRLRRHLNAGISYEEASAKVAWQAAREVACKVPDKFWSLDDGIRKKPMPFDKGLITMAIDWPHGHPFIDLSLGIIWPQDAAGNMQEPYKTSYEKLGKGFQSAEIKLNRKAVLEAIQTLGFDWGKSIEGKDVTSPPARQINSAKGKIQAALRNYSDTELQKLTAGGVMKRAEDQSISMSRSNCDEVLRAYKISRGITPNLPKGKNTLT